MEFEPLCDLEISPRTDWKIKIRLARKWKEIYASNGELKGIHLVFVDEYVSLRILLLYKILYY